MHPLETYLEELRAIRSSGAVVKETSGYGALANLFNAIGHTLKPRVRCFIHVKNSGAGLPDGGLFTPDQLTNPDEEAPLLGIPLPARGVIEVKATNAEVNGVADTLQVREYVSIDFATWFGYVVRAGNWIFSRTTVLRFDRPGLLCQVKAMPLRHTGGEPAGGLGYPGRFGFDRSVCCFVFILNR